MGRAYLGRARALTAALAYAERLGWAVFPQRGKLPADCRAGHGFLDATTDPDRVRELWDRYPGANIGVSCIASGFVALDVDPRNGGDATLAEIGHLLPETAWSSTGGGGAHILLTAPADLNPRCTLGPGIDIKWRGSITLPPSIHPIGRPYRWATRGVPLAAIPDSLLALISRKEEPAAVPTPVHVECDRYGRAALASAVAIIRTAMKGTRDNTLIRESFGIGRLIGAGLIPRDAAIAALVSAGLCVRGREWTDKQLVDKVTRAIAAGELRPRQVSVASRRAKDYIRVST